METKKLNLREKEKKLIRILKEAYVDQNGNAIRLLNRTIAKAYQENPKKLKRYFKYGNELLAGIATSSYHFISGDIKPITKIKKGGLGAIVRDSEENLRFSREQLHFSRIRGDALKKSRNKGNSLWYSEITENAGEESINSENSMSYSKFKLGALWKSKNSGNALIHCELYDNVLWNSQNTGDVLRCCRKGKYVLKASTNTKKVQKNLSKSY